MEAPSLLTSWNFEPLQVVPTLLVGLLYARSVRTLREAGTPVSAWRIWCFGSSLFLVLVALVSPIDEFGEEQFLFMHMVQHILLGDLAPLLFVAGLTGPILRPVLSLPGRAPPALPLHPLVALPLWAANLYIWHIPLLYQGALHHSAVHALEHFCFFAFGAIMWAAVARDAPGARMVRHGRQARLRRGASACWRRSSATSSSGRGWSSTRSTSTRTDMWGISALGDQQIAGAVMMVEGSIVTLGVLAWLFLKMAQESELRQRLIEQGMDERAVKRAVRYGRAGVLGPE